MNFGGFSVDSPHSAPLVRPVGALILNFGSVELLSMMWIAALTSESVLVDRALVMLFSKRVELIRDLMAARETPRKLEKAASKAWADAERLAMVRNDVAHSPIIFGWHGPEEQRPPDFLGTFNVKKLRGKKPEQLPLLDKGFLDAKNDEIVRLAQRLGDLLKEVTEAAKAAKAAASHRPPATDAG